MDKLQILIIMLSVSLTGAVSYTTKYLIDKKNLHSEDAEVKEAIKSIQIEVPKSDNVLKLMLNNVKELREYYIISKQQARKSFSAALFSCFIGSIIYILGICTTIFLSKDVSTISVIGGTVVEVIAGLFFWLYKEAVRQLDIYHQRLGATERYLIAYQMICEVPDDRKYEEQRNFINYVLNDNQRLQSLSKNEEK